jgi:hypothetical protein
VSDAYRGDKTEKKGIFYKIIEEEEEEEEEQGGKGKEDERRRKNVSDGYKG